MKQVNRRTSAHRQIALVVTSIVAVLLVACGDVARSGGAAPTATEPIIVNAVNVPGTAGVPLDAHTLQSDVTIEVRNGTASAQIVQLLSASSGVDWDTVREGFEASPAPIGAVMPPTLSSVMKSAAHEAPGACTARDHRERHLRGRKRERAVRRPRGVAGNRATAHASAVRGRGG
jgi:hypothetical protein